MYRSMITASSLLLVRLGIDGYTSFGGSSGLLVVVNLLVSPWHVISWFLHPCGVFEKRASFVGDIQYFHVLSMVAFHGPNTL
eukprot:scaffold127835_cov48-Attheya_sp.AAC.1